jgi:arylsulfatase A-like enzyme
VLFPLWGDPTITHVSERPASHRNLILISLDTLRADRVGVYGSYRPTTPALDALAAESAVFTNAWSPWPETSGSHMSLFTSRYPSEHGVTGFIVAPAAALELLAERLRREGYLTRAFTEDGGVWAQAGFARGFSAYSERRSPDAIYRGEAAATFADATRWVRAHADRPFFLFVHTYQVHAPYTPPRSHAELFPGIVAREPTAFAADALSYDREVRFTDDQLAGFIGSLRELGLADRTIVIITSDHGEEFGEHGDRGHGRSLHREVLAVPLIVWAPGLLPPARVDTPASLLDVAPSVLELLALEPTPSYRGTSLVGAVPAAAPRRSPAPDAPRDVFGEVDRFDRKRVHQVSVRREGRTAILDLTTNAVRCYGPDDAGEQRPSDACPDLVARITEHRQSMKPLGTLAPQAVDPRLIEKMRALGYLQ